MHLVRLQREVGIGKESEKSCEIMQYKKIPDKSIIEMLNTA